MATMGLKIVDLMENPFYFSEIIISLIKSYKDRPLNFWEVYIIIPLIFNNESKALLKNYSSRTRIEKIFYKKEYLLEILFSEREYYREILNKSMIILLDEEKISLDKKNGNLSTKIKSEILDDDILERVKKVGKICSKEKIEYIFSVLGVD